MSYGEHRLLLCLAAGLLLTWVVVYFLPTSCDSHGTYDSPAMMFKEPSTFVMGGKEYTYSRDMPLIFIGGVPRSGTTLMRAMLDAHPDVRCGQETHVIPFLLEMRSRWLRSQRESVRLEEAGVSREVLNTAIAAFFLEVIVHHGDPAPRLCNKDPMTLKSAAYLAELFPQAKFIFMVRDGRATVHSIISRQVAIRGFSLNDYRQCLMDWNRTITLMYEQCSKIGSSRCFIVHYEQLVLHPRGMMAKILRYVDVPWNDSVLHHEDFINVPGGVLLSRAEKSTDQVIKPINLDALANWVGHIPPDVIEDMAQLAPMLSVLGYDPHANPPNYRSPDLVVEENMRHIHDSKELWEPRNQDFPTPIEVF